jgi:hypothetical protein
MMVQVAMQLGLHRPSHTQDFSKFRVELIEEELRDKVRTWAICNIVAQRYVTTTLAIVALAHLFPGYRLATDSHHPLFMTGHYLQTIL